MDNTAEFEDLVRKLDLFEKDAKNLQVRIARLMHHAREVSGTGDSAALDAESGEQSG